MAWAQAARRQVRASEGTRTGLALAQCAPALGDLKANLDLHRELTEQAIGESADLVIFPELGLTGYYGVRSYDEGLAGDSGYLVTPELKYALPDILKYRHSIGVFTDVGGVLLENPAFTTTQNAFTQLNDIGLGYYATYEYSPNRFLLLKAQVAHSYGSTSGAQIYNQGTKGLLQAGFTF